MPELCKMSIALKYSGKFLFTSLKYKFNFYEV